MPKKPAQPHVLRGAAALSRDSDFHGLSAKQVRGRALQHPFRGVIALDLDLATVADAALAFEPLLRHGEAFSHSTGYALLGGPLPLDVRPLPLHLTSAARARKRRGVISHQASTPPPIVLVRGLPVVAPAQLWCQLGIVLARRDLVAAGDFLVTPRRWGRSALTTLAELSAAVSAFRGAGRAALTWALPLVRVGAQSRPETLLRLMLVEAGLPEPVIGHGITVDGGRLVLHPDLAYPRWRIAIEYEGDQHRTDARQWRRDLTRHELMRDEGWTVIRVHAADLGHPERLVARIRRYAGI